MGQAEPTIEIAVYRYNPAADAKSRLESYCVPYYPRATVLSALLYISQHLDPTLVFRYGCRFQKCGQCAVEVNGRPRLACLTYLRSGLTVRPLAKFPVVRDLAIDRQGLWEKLIALELYLQGRLDLTQDVPPTLPTLQEPEAHKNLMACRECLCCQAACPAWQGPGSDFGGPYLFVKLAQLLWDPRDDRDRYEQARLLGIERCRSCGKCYCPLGVRIWREAILPLLDGRRGSGC